VPNDRRIPDSCGHPLSRRSGDPAEGHPRQQPPAPSFQALADLNIHAEPAVYHDDFCEEVRRQLVPVDAVLVWRNPIQDGCDRSILDPMLREVAAAGKFVSVHPDLILKMGTKFEHDL
jgi:hypothetical protein